MSHTRFSVALKPVFILIAVALLLMTGASAGVTENSFYFDMADGATPSAGLIPDTAGNLYGTTTVGGPANGGVVFEMKPGEGGWSETVLYGFTGGADGGSPSASVTFDGAGNLYGTTSYGGNNNCSHYGAGCGVVYELSPTGNGQWTEKVLYSFAGAPDGANPGSALIFDGAGNLYGTTSVGGNTNPTACSSGGCGVVFELTPAGNGQWTEKVLYAFTGGNDGAQPEAALTFDSAGNLYSTTSIGGDNVHECGNVGCGTVFELTPAGNGQWAEALPHLFAGGVDGFYPSAGVIFDAAGNLYGTTSSGGEAGCKGLGGCGIVYELTPGQHGQWPESILHTFAGGRHDGEFPYAAVIFDAAGNLYGTTVKGGSHTAGTVYRISPGGNGQWTEKAYPISNGAWPSAVVFDSHGHLWATTFYGGPDDYGTVFELQRGAVSR